MRDNRSGTLLIFLRERLRRCRFGIALGEHDPPAFAKRTRRRHAEWRSLLPPDVETDAAILLRKIKLTESSLIVTWFTQTHGKLKTVAKGARRPRSAFAGRLDLFFAAEITFARSGRSELHTLREVVVGDSREGLRQLYSRTELASYFVELVEITTEFDHPAPEIHDLLRRALDYLTTNEPTRRAMLHFETQLSALLGLTGAHNPGDDAGHAIGRLAGRLPEGRTRLLRSLPAKIPVTNPPPPP